MSGTITLGWWIVPALITLVTIGGLFTPSQPSRGYGDIGTGIAVMFHLLLGTIISLAAWLIWSLLS